MMPMHLHSVNQFYLGLVEFDKLDFPVRFSCLVFELDFVDRCLCFFPMDDAEIIGLTDGLS
jgi:hypothetical protein